MKPLPTKPFLLYDRFIAFSILLVLFFICAFPTLACTIFVLTDGNKTLFFNNEDFSNPNTRIWFVPAGKDHYGCVYLGFDDGHAQGGMNTEGLAFDWYAGGKVNYAPDENMVLAKGSTSKRMLESCTTVEEAIQFYQTYAETSFSYATILIADKSGKSVIIGASNGKIYFKPLHESRALGYGNSTFDKMYSKETPIDLTSGIEILKTCEQKGEFATKYSNIFDLRTGDISLYQFTENSGSSDLNLFSELEKGGHYYDIPDIKTQIEEESKPLLLNMHRLVLFDFEDISDQEPDAIAKAKKMVLDGANGTMQAEDYSDEFWKEVKNEKEQIQSDLRKLGNIKSIHLIQKVKVDDLFIYSYIIVFDKARILMDFTFDEDFIAYKMETKRVYISNMDIFRQSGSARDNLWIQIGLLIIGVAIVFMIIYMFIARKKKIALLANDNS